MPECFDDVLLDKFMRTFYGYGTHEAPYWLIGMEEGGGGSFTRVEERLRNWRDAGQPALMTLKPRTHIQATWGRLIRVVLAARGETATRARVKEYQDNELGQTSGDACLMELLPLPSPDTTRWMYADHSAIPWLKDRAVYRDRTAPWRADAIRALIEEHRPPVVVFYGSSYRHWWKRIAGTSFERDAQRDFETATVGTTTFLSMPHPTYRGLSNEYFAAVGTRISAGRPES